MEPSVSTIILRRGGWRLGRIQADGRKLGKLDLHRAFIRLSKHIGSGWPGSHGTKKCLRFYPNYLC